MAGRSHDTSIGIGKVITAINTIVILSRVLHGWTRWVLIVIALVGFVWTVATYFVVPVLVVEGVGPIQAVTTMTDGDGGM